jgi:hypothetical protein
MTSDGDDAADGTAAATLLALATNMEVMQRLLGRQNRDGGLVPADAALIQIAIDTARAEARRVGDLLSRLPDDATSSDHASAATMLKAVANLDAVLDVLTDTVCGLSR